MRYEFCYVLNITHVDANSMWSIPLSTTGMESSGETCESGSRWSALKVCAHIDVKVLTVSLSTSLSGFEFKCMLHYFFLIHVHMHVCMYKCIL